MAAAGAPFVEKRILILGMTYPSYSTKYVENVCTGGIEEGTLNMVRIHPVPLRYLEPARRFKAFQWIKVRARTHPSDGRPESLQIDDENIQPMEVIPASRSEDRRRFLEKSPHCVQSVEDLHQRWKQNRTSLGIVRPKEILEVRVLPRPRKERDQWLAKERMLLGQKHIWDRAPRRLDWPEVSFKVKWRCDDPHCTVHEMDLLQWGLHELYRKLGGDPRRDEKVVQKMKKQLDLNHFDVFLFLGNFRTTQVNFGLMDAYSAPRQAKDFQGRLF